MAVLREIKADDWRVHLDVSDQVLKLEIPEMISGWEREGRESPLLPLLPRLEGGPVSAAALLFKAKQFDDGLYAAVEQAAQSGAGTFSGKEALLRSLAAVLTASDALSNREAAAFILAACELGNILVSTPPGLDTDVHTLRTLFLADERSSKPLGFYTWTPDLQAIFHQDRFLQAPLAAPLGTTLAHALDQTADGWRTYYPSMKDAHIVLAAAYRAFGCWK